MIDVAEIRKVFSGGTVLDGVSFQVPAGHVFALLGPNGAGKTTLVRILSTLLTPDAGHARVAGYDVVRERVQVRARIGLTAQHATVDDVLTGRENLVLFGRLNRLGARAARCRAAELIERLGLGPAADRRVATYSGGMRRRIDLAASLVANPEVLFLDEPTTGLDPTSRRELWGLVRASRAAGTTILLTTQYLEEADQLADRIAVLRSGRIVANDAPDILKRRVGAELLSLSVDAAQWGQAIQLLPDAFQDGGRVSVPLRGPDHLRQCLTWLNEAGISVRDLELRRPTLDDVFFALTTQEVPA